jgi:hypothetical protein
MTDRDRASILRDRITRAIDHGPDPDMWRAALTYYLGRPRGDELAGQPALQSTDVADMVHAVQAQLMPSFCGDQVCSFDPDGPDDDNQARLESDAVNRTMMEEGRGYVVIGAAIKDSLLLKNGIVKVWCEDEEQVATRRMDTRGRPEAQRMLQGETGDDVDVETDDEGYTTLTARRTVRRLRMAAVDPLNFVVDPDHDSVLLEDAPLVAERWPVTRGELVALGYAEDTVKSIPTEDGYQAQTIGMRQREGEAPTDTTTWQAEQVYCWRVYDRKDGELTYTLLGGTVILEEEPAAFIPYAAGTPFPEAHGFWGLSLFDRLKTVQDAKTMALRQWVANLMAGNLPRTAINDNVMAEDLLNGRPSGVVRVEGTAPVGESILPIPAIDSGASSATFLAYFDQVRADRGGAALQMANAESQLVGAQVGSMGVDRIVSVQEQMAAFVARNLAETLLRSLFLLVHRTLAEQYGQPMSLRLADQWVTADPSQFRQRSRVNIKHGLSPGEKARKAAGMQAVVTAQMTMLQAGMDGVLVDLPSLYNSLLDLAGALELDNAQSYFVDPAGQAAQQVAAEKGQQGQQMQAMQLQLTQVQLQMEQAKLQLEQQKLQLDKYKHDQEMAKSYREMALNAEIEEAKLTASVTTDLIAAQQSARDAAARADSGGANGDGR